MKTKSKTIKETKDKKKRKRTARVICHDKNEFWTTQTQFWQWVRELKVIKLHNSPLTGMFARPDEESMIVINNTVLNRVHRNHIGEVLASRRLMKPRKS